jgi:selenophosphate synthetase-related protein
MHTAFDNAISAHISWLTRFQNVLLGLDRERFDLEQISDPTLCEFGRWLLANPDFASHPEQVERVKTLHQRFHEKAAVIAGLLGSYARHRVIEAHWNDLSELSGQLVETLYEIREQQSR